MVDTFDFGAFKQYEIKKENIGAILLDVDALDTNGSVCAISDLNRIRIDLSIKRENREPLVIYKGFLQNLLNIKYQQSTQLELVLQKLDSGYKILLSMGAFPYTLFGEDKLIVDLNFPKEAFTSCTNGSVTIETIAADELNNSGAVQVYEDFIVVTGKSAFDENIGSDISAVLLEVDNSQSYDTSTLAKPVDVDIIARGDYTKKQTQNSLIAQNTHMLHYNPESEVKNLWLYKSNSKLLNDATLRIKFDKAVGVNSIIQVERLVFS